MRRPRLEQGWAGSANNRVRVVQGAVADRSRSRTQHPVGKISVLVAAPHRCDSFALIITSRLGREARAWAIC